MIDEVSNKCCKTPIVDAILKGKKYKLNTYKYKIVKPVESFFVLRRGCQL